MEECVLLTGATSDIGRAIAQRLGGSHRLMLHGRDATALADVRDACPGTGHHCWVHDLHDVVGVEASLGRFLQQHALGVTHLVHAAGRLEVGPLRSMDADRVSGLFQVNVFSGIELVRQLSRRRVNGDCLRSVLFLSSIAARIGVQGYGAYAASKGALGALARSLAVELAPQVRVNCLLPGPIETRGTAAVLGKGAPADPRCLLGPGVPLDVAGLTEFLLSADARWITGQEFVVDGGFTAH